VYGPLRPIFLPADLGDIDPSELLRLLAKQRFDLSSQDIHLLQYLTEGLSNKEIAVRLNVADYTVKNRLKTLFRKLDVTDRKRAAAIATHCGFGTRLASLPASLHGSRSKDRAEID
jgi:DNA-binding NarL/FixJ family response regulator